MFGSVPRIGGLDAWVEMNRHRQLFEGLLLVCSDMSDGGSRSQITEIEFWGEHAWPTEQRSQQQLQDLIVHFEEPCTATRNNRLIGL
jgi:hypothetical protein